MKIHIFLALILLLPTSAFAQSYSGLNVKVEDIADNLNVPWSMVWSPDGSIFFTERIGNLRVIQNGILISDPILTLDVGVIEGGLLGIALDPDYLDNHYIYLYYTYVDLSSIKNKVTRFVELNGSIIQDKVLVDQIPGGPFHNGGRIKFGPDKKLYITTGEAGNPELSQNINSLGGKILRINSDGSIPEDNPFPNSPVYSLGHRNPQGIAWDRLGNMIVTEHGPSGWRGMAHDEINLILAGMNYGWPDIIGDEIKYGMQNPILHSGDETWAPSGATFYYGDKIPQWQGKFFVATLRGSHLHMIDFDLENKKILSHKELFAGEFGRLRDIVESPDGYLYMLTSNQDGRGSPISNDDRILRIVPLEDNIASPLKQIKNGVIENHVKCKNDMVLIFKYDGSPACVKKQNVGKLIQREGWMTYDQLESTKIIIGKIQEND